MKIAMSFKVKDLEDPHPRKKKKNEKSAVTNTYLTCPRIQGQRSLPPQNV